MGKTFVRSTEKDKGNTYSVYSINFDGFGLAKMTSGNEAGAELYLAGV